MSCSNGSSETPARMQPLNLESSTLPLNHCTPSIASHEGAILTTYHHYIFGMFYSNAFLSMNDIVIEQGILGMLKYCLNSTLNLHRVLKAALLLIKYSCFTMLLPFHFNSKSGSSEQILYITRL